MTKNKNIILVAILIVLAGMLRLIDHPMNFTPVVGIIIFGAAILKNKALRFILPISVILFSDILIELSSGYGFHSGSVWVYLSFAAIFGLSVVLLKKFSVPKLAITTLLGSSLFFLITNFAFLYPVSPIPNPALGTYPHNITGIIASYQAGIPFFRNMLAGDLFFTASIFGIYFLAKKYFYKIQTQNI